MIIRIMVVAVMRLGIGIGIMVVGVMKMMYENRDNGSRSNENNV